MSDAHPNHEAIATVREALEKAKNIAIFSYAYGPGNHQDVQLMKNALAALDTLSAAQVPTVDPETALLNSGMVIDKMREALKFYANGNVKCFLGSPIEGLQTTKSNMDIGIPCGTKAKQALATTTT